MVETLRQILFFWGNKKSSSTMEENIKPNATLTFIFTAPGTIDLRKSLYVNHPMITRIPITIVVMVAIKEIILACFLVIKW